ncbi:MAG: DoxX family membrane protein [bacterium]|nr:DoxX family membrane protein [bacterium]
MLSFFPTLFSYELVVPFVFRVVIGLAFIWFGYENIIKKREVQIALLPNLKSSSDFWLWVIAVIYITGGLLLVAGLYTQVTALVFSILLLLAAIAKRKNPEAASLPQTTTLLLLLISASLLFLGPGFYAIDLPL